ncbi:hypothetical protein VKT23_017988 [Stygiomarasmius scandens]|uniref:Uncharacterized protein n=1 Tax=Marasmiellus scandens TaxID=2682957 RepID=A0ABR1IQ69_9AGAR
MPRFSWKDSSVLITLAFITGTSARPSPFFETGPMVATPEGKVCKDGEIGIGTRTTDGGTKGVIVANNCNPICSNGPVLSATSTYCTGGFDDDGCSVTCSSAFGSLGQPSEAVTTDKRHWNQCYRPNIAQTCMISTGATIIDWCCIGSDTNSDSSSSADAASSTTSETNAPASSAGSDSTSGSGSNPPSDDGTSEPSNADSNSPPDSSGDASSSNDNTPANSDSTSGTPVDPSANAASDAGGDSTSASGDDSDNSDGDASSVVRKRRVRL